MRIQNLKELKKIFKRSTVFFNEPLSRHTSLRVGGPADVFVVIEDISELRRLLKFAGKAKIPVFVIGGGTNLLVSDRGIRGIVIKLGRAFSGVRFGKTRIEVGASTPISELLNKLARKGLSGLEFMAGIPGTAGGAAISNAGSSRQAIGEFISSVKIMSHSGKILNIHKKKLKFSYRKSSLKGLKGVLLEVSLEGFKKASGRAVRDKILLLLKKRKNTQPVNRHSAGCIFKNPPNCPAGLLIDLAGFKGERIGGAQVSKKHANFILNCRKATCRDIMRLIEKIQKKVYRQFRIKLELEVEKAGVFT